MFTVQSRLLGLVAMMLLLLLGGAAMLHHFETVNASDTLEEQRSAKQLLLRKIVDLRSASLVSYSYDYSIWDEMLRFVKEPDADWGRVNIDQSLVTYDASGAWVCRPDLSLVYLAFRPGISEGPESPFAGSMTAKVRAGQHFSHFFVRSGSGLWEISGAPIQPSDDSLRQTTPQGYFFTGRFWSDDYVATLEKFAETELTLSFDLDHAQRVIKAADPATVAIMDTLKDCSGHPLAGLIGLNRSAFVAGLQQRVVTRSLALIVFCLLLIVVVWYTLHRSVTRPLRSISAALADDDPLPLERLKSGGGEFGQIAHLITNFFHQNASLIKEIVDHERAENALKQTTSRLSALADEQRILLENTRDFLYRHDTRGVFHYVSQSVQAVTGYSPDEWMKHYTTFLTDHPVNGKVIEVTERTLREGTSFPPYQVEIYHKSGHRVMLEVSEQPYLASGKVAGIVGVARDVTQRVQSEEQREALQRRLERAERMESLGLLAGGVAHDLNNILGPLVAYPELILMKLPPDSPHRRQLETMGKAAQDAADVIQDLLALARRGRYDMKPTDLNDVIKQYLESPNFLSLRNSHPRVSVVTELDSSIGAILGSSTHMMKAIMNLVVNAFEAMPDGGELHLATSFEHLSRLRSDFERVTEGTYVLLRIRDTGVGIEPAAIPKIFQPYYSNKQMGSSGSGLGLAVVYGIVKDHKGYYDVFSEVGKGTEFVLYLPKCSQEIPAPASSGASLEGTGTILVVDDVEEQRGIAEQILTSLGYTVATVSTGREAVAYVSEHAVDLVLLDMILERDYDGLDTFSAIRAIRPEQKAIIVSGFAATERVAQMQAAGAGSYIKKPYSRMQLAEAVKKSLLASNVESSPTSSTI